MMNALYGATANKYFIYYIGKMAEAITTSGQMAVRYAEQALNKYMNKIMGTKDVDYGAYIDTDSCYMNFEPLIIKVFGTSDISKEQGEAFLDKVSKEKIEPVIDAAYEEMAKYMGAYENKMVMKREKINDRAVFVAKKKYVLNTLNSEGVHYATPKVSVTGLESVRSSTPEICRNKLKEAFSVIMTKTEEDIQEFIADFKQEFMKLAPEDIGKNTGTDEIEKFMDSTSLYKKGTPIHYRGCILYNDFIKRKGLDNKIETISSGDKVKFVYLKLPNPVRENVISFPTYLPKEMGLDNYIDYELQFEKVFLKPLKNTLDAVGWSTEKTYTLDSFFG